jgi:hypothetical protein
MKIGGHVTPACAVQGGLSASFEAAARTDLGLKTADAIPVEGFLPLRKFFLGEHIAVVGFEPAKYPAANRDHDPGFFPSAPPCQTGWRDEENFLLGHSALALASVVVGIFLRTLAATPHQAKTNESGTEEGKGGRLRDPHGAATATESALTLERAYAGLELEVEEFRSTHQVRAEIERRNVVGEPRQRHRECVRSTGRQITSTTTRAVRTSRGAHVNRLETWKVLAEERVEYCAVIGYPGCVWINVEANCCEPPGRKCGARQIFD